MWGPAEGLVVEEEEEEEAVKKGGGRLGDHRGVDTVPCSRTPPFFLKRGLPDHSWGLVRQRGRERLVNHQIALQRRQRPSSGGSAAPRIVRREFEPISKCL